MGRSLVVRAGYCRRREVLGFGHVGSTVGTPKNAFAAFGRLVWRQHCKPTLFFPLRLP